MKNFYCDQNAMLTCCWLQHLQPLHSQPGGEVQQGQGEGRGSLSASLWLGWAGVSCRIFCEWLTVVSALSISLCPLFSLAAGDTTYGGSSSLEISLAFCSTSTALLKAVQSACGCVVKLWELDINMLEMELEEADLDICPPDFFSKKNRNLCSHGPPLLSFSRYWKDSCHLPFLRFL